MGQGGEGKEGGGVRQGSEAKMRQKSNEETQKQLEFTWKAGQESMVCTNTELSPQHCTSCSDWLKAELPGKLRPKSSFTVSSTVAK